MKKIIIATHGYLAQGYKSALGIITNDVDSLIDINGFTPDCENPEEEILALLARYPQEDDLLILTDVFFGSINQFFMRQMEKRRLKVVTGINLPVAMELVMRQKTGDISEEDLLAILQAGKREMRLITKEDVDGFLGDASADEEEEL